MIAILSVTLFVVERIFILDTMEYIEFELIRIKNQRKSFDDIINLCIQQLENDIRETIKKRWLSSESVNGGNITNISSGESGYARLSYKNLKIKKNPSAGGKVDLTFTGSLGDKIIIVKGESGDHEIISTDSKYEVIGKMYGFDEFGLSQLEKANFMKILEININNKL